MSNVTQLTLYSHQQEYLFRYQRNKTHGSFTAEEKKEKKKKKNKKSQAKTQKMA